jgi:hypothetical protein
MSPERNVDIRHVSRENIRRDAPRLIARELCGALRDGALRAHGAIG